MAHDGHHRRARLQIFRLVVHVEFYFFLGLMNDAFALGAFFRFQLEAKMRANLRGHFFVNGLVDRRHDLKLHQLGDDGKRFLLHRLRERADDDRRLDDDNLRVGRQGNFRCLRCAGPGGRWTRQRPAVATALRKLLTAIAALRWLTGAAGGGRWPRRSAAAIAFAGPRRTGAGSELDKTDFVANAGHMRDGRGWGNHWGRRG